MTFLYNSTFALLTVLESTEVYIRPRAAKDFCRAPRRALLQPLVYTVSSYSKRRRFFMRRLGGFFVRQVGNLHLFGPYCHHDHDLTENLLTGQYLIYGSSSLKIWKALLSDDDDEMMGTITEITVVEKNFLHIKNIQDSITKLEAAFLQFELEISIFIIYARNIT